MTQHVPVDERVPQNEYATPERDGIDERIAAVSLEKILIDLRLSGLGGARYIHATRLKRADETIGLHELGLRAGETLDLACPFRDFELERFTSSLGLVEVYAYATTAHVEQGLYEASFELINAFLLVGSQFRELHGQDAKRAIYIALTVWSRIRARQPPDILLDRLRRQPSERGRDGTGLKRESGAIGFASLRGGTIVGDHDMLFLGPDERLILSHRAESRAIFARGALAAARFLVGQPAGLYSMRDVVDSL
jgi:hypothetical protein